MELADRQDVSDACALQDCLVLQDVEPAEIEPILDATDHGRTLGLILSVPVLLVIRFPQDSWRLILQSQSLCLQSLGMCIDGLDLSLVWQFSTL